MLQREELQTHPETMPLVLCDNGTAESVAAQAEVLELFFFDD